jgi:uncharacterized protein (DUF58 family)
MRRFHSKKLRRFTIEDNHLITPFNEPARDLSIMNRPLKIHHSDILDRVCGPADAELPLKSVQDVVQVASPDDEVLVLPRIRDDVLPPEEFLALTGDESRSISGSGEEPWNIVEFTSGDNPRHIHWKSSAKRDELMKKEFMAQTERMMTLRLVDADDEEDILEERIERAATLVDHFIRKGHPTGMLLPGLFISPKRGVYQCVRILEALALYTPYDDSTIPAPGPDITGVVFDV